MNTLTLAPALWLPKPATIWIPQVTKSLRESWSPGERENRFQRFVDRNPAVSPLELQPGVNDIRSRNIGLPLPGGEGRGEGTRLSPDKLRAFDCDCSKHELRLCRLTPRDFHEASPGNCDSPASSQGDSKRLEFKKAPSPRPSPVGWERVAEGRVRVASLSRITLRTKDRGGWTGSSRSKRTVGNADLIKLRSVFAIADRDTVRPCGQAETSETCPGPSADRQSVQRRPGSAIHSHPERIAIGIRTIDATGHEISSCVRHGERNGNPTGTCGGC